MVHVFRPSGPTLRKELGRFPLAAPPAAWTTRARWATRNSSRRWEKELAGVRPVVQAVSVPGTKSQVTQSKVDCLTRRSDEDVGRPARRMALGAGALDAGDTDPAKRFQRRHALVDVVVEVAHEVGG